MAIEGFIDGYVYRYAAIRDEDTHIPRPVRCTVSKTQKLPSETVIIRTVKNPDTDLRIPSKYVRKTERECERVCQEIIAGYIRKHERRLEELKFAQKPDIAENRENLRKTQQIVEKLKEKKSSDTWIMTADRNPTESEIRRQDGRILVTDGVNTYQRLYDPKTNTFKRMVYPQGMEHRMETDKNVIAWKTMPDYENPNKDFSLASEYDKINT